MRDIQYRKKGSWKKRVTELPTEPNTWEEAAWLLTLNVGHSCYFWARALCKCAYVCLHMWGVYALTLCIQKCVSIQYVAVGSVRLPRSLLCRYRAASHSSNIFNDTISITRPRQWGQTKTLWVCNTNLMIMPFCCIDPFQSLSRHKMHICSHAPWFVCSHASFNKKWPVCPLYVSHSLSRSSSF